MKKIAVLLSLLVLGVASCFAEPTSDVTEFTWDNWLFFWRLHIESILLLGVSIWEFFTLRQEAEKRDKRLEFRILILGAMTVFMNCIFTANHIRVLFPLACAIMLVYPFYYKDLGEQKMKQWIWIGVGVIAVLSITNPMKSLGLIFGQIIGFVVFGLIFYFKAKSMLKDICPHCNYYAHHPKIQEEVLAEHTEKETYVHTDYHGSTKEKEWLSGKTVITDYYATHKDEDEKLIQFIEQTFECQNCHNEFTRHFVTSKLVGHRRIY